MTATSPMKRQPNSTFLYGANVRANGIRQHYLRFGGKGLPLVIVPGITSPAVTWGFLAERLGRSHDVHVLDVRGRGLSEADDRLDYGISASAADVVSFVDELGLGGCILMGHSYGARISLRATSSGPPAMVSRLVVIDPPVSGPGRRRYPAEIGWYVESIRQAARGADANQMREYLPDWSLEHLQLRAEWLHTCNEKAVIESYRDMHDDDMFVDLQDISPPTLFIVAGKGGVIQAPDINEIRTAMTHAVVHVVESAGHMVPWDDEEAFFAAVNPFISFTS